MALRSPPANAGLSPALHKRSRCEGPSTKEPCTSGGEAGINAISGHQAGSEQQPPTPLQAPPPPPPQGDERAASEALQRLRHLWRPAGGPDPCRTAVRLVMSPAPPGAPALVSPLAFPSAGAEQRREAKQPKD